MIVVENYSTLLDRLNGVSPNSEPRGVNGPFATCNKSLIQRFYANPHWAESQGACTKGLSVPLRLLSGSSRLFGFDDADDLVGLISGMRTRTSIRSTRCPRRPLSECSLVIWVVRLFRDGRIPDVHLIR